MENDSPNLGLLYENGKYSYGIITIENKNSPASRGEKVILRKNLLQEDIVIPFQSEEEKEEILKVIPDSFLATISGNNIIIEFEKEKISSPLYVNEYYRGGYFSSSVDYYSYKKQESKTIEATLKNPELTRAIKDLRVNIYSIKSKYEPENCIDKYSASSNISLYFLWLIETGQAEAIDENGNISEEEYMRIKSSPFHSTKFKIRFNGKEYNISFGDSDSLSYFEDFGELKKDYQEYVKKLKEDREYFFPETEIPRYKAPKVGIEIVKVDEDKYIVADREKIYTQISGTPIFKESFILTEDKSIVYGSGKKEIFSDIMHTKVKDSNYMETETFIGYNDNQIIFIQDRDESYDRKKLSSESIQRFEREDLEHPVKMFSIGDTVGFIDGKKVKISNKSGEISTFEIEEDIENIDIQNGYILINGNILCCGVRYNENSWSRDEKIALFCKKINNPKRIEMFMQDSNIIQQSSFIENENGCFFIEGLTEEEKLRLYQENGFSELYEKLESTIIARKEAQREEARKIEEARNKTNEYLAGKTLSLCHLRKYSSRRGKIIEADNVEFVENDNAVVLFEKEEKGWGYGPVYEAGIINVTEARKRTKGGKLHVDVPEVVMGMVIGRQGSNINAVTSILKEKGIDLSKIILHPKSREEIKITLESIEKAIKEQRAQSHED